MLHGLLCAAGSRFQISPEGFCLVGVLFGLLQLILGLGFSVCGLVDIVLSIFLYLRNICARGPLILVNSRELGNMDFPGVLICFLFGGGKKNNRPVLIDEEMLVPFTELLTFWKSVFRAALDTDTFNFAYLHSDI